MASELLRRGLGRVLEGRGGVAGGLGEGSHGGFAVGAVWAGCVHGRCCGCDGTPMAGSAEAPGGTTYSKGCSSCASPGGCQAPGTAGAVDEAVRMRCMLLAAHLAVRELNGTEARELALSIVALPSIKSEAQCLVAVLRGQIGHGHSVRRIGRVFQLCGRLLWRLCLCHPCTCPWTHWRCFYTL